MTIPAAPTLATTPQPPSRADPQNFASRMDAFLAWIPSFVVFLQAALVWILSRCQEVSDQSAATQSDRALCQTAQAAITAQSPISSAAAAAASAGAAAVYAAQAQATNPDSPIRLNPRRITANFAIPGDSNAASVGPITVADGVTVTVSDNATWSIH